MKIYLVTASLILAVIVPLILAGQEPHAPRKSLSLPLDGAAIFRDYCAVCHGSDGKGKGPATDALRHAPPDLTLLSSHNSGKFPADRVKAIMSGREQSIAAHGSREMPMWGPIFHTIERDQDFGEVRLENVTKFVESLQRK